MCIVSVCDCAHICVCVCSCACVCVSKGMYAVHCHFPYCFLAPARHQLYTLIRLRSDQCPSSFSTHASTSECCQQVHCVSVHQKKCLYRHISHCHISIVCACVRACICMRVQIFAHDHHSLCMMESVPLEKQVRGLLLFYTVPVCTHCVATQLSYAFISLQTLLVQLEFETVQ